MYQTIFKLKYVIFLALVGGVFSLELHNLDNLGYEISEQVNRELAPLHNLGSRISARVEENLKPIHSSFHNHNFNPANTNFNLNHLSNLGQQIEESVNQQLEPVRAIEIVFKMKGGVGGTTIATHLPEGKQFLIRNNQILVCSGSISEDNGECSGNLSPFQINDKQDYCYYKNGYSIINNYICIGASTVSVINNEVVCKSNTETPALLVTINEFNKLCAGHSEKVEYKYIANPNDIAHVEIPNKNKHVKCTNNQAGVCIFSESLFLPQNAQYSYFHSSTTSNNFNHY